MKLALYFFSIAVFIAAALVRPAEAEPPIVIRFSHVAAPGTPKGRAAKRFKELAEARTQGRVRVEIYANSRLYKDKEELEALQMGAVQMLAPSLSKFGPLGIPRFELFDLPYLFPNEDAFLRVARGGIGQDLLRSLEDRGIRGLAFWSGGFHVFSANRPLLKPGDLRGLKMRVPESFVLETSLRQLGALPQVIAFSDVYPALKSGAIDGTENVLSTYTSQRYYEVQKHITLTYHTHTGYAVIVNNKFWGALPRDIRAALESAISDATDYEINQIQQENEQALRFLEASRATTIQRLSETERSVWVRAMAPVYRAIEARIGRDLIASVQKEAAAPR